MKLYVYVSESEKISDLVPITETARAYNAANDITGIFSYNHGYYLQVIEGENDAVESLVKRIWVDKRHQNVTEILDVEIDERFFTDWSMNLIPLLKRNETFQTFVDSVNDNIDLLTYQQRDLMKLFCDLNNLKAHNNRKGGSLKALKYSISEWPNGDVINASSSLLSLCGTLMNNPTNFRKLVGTKTHGSKKEVRSMLNQLNKAGFLKVTQTGNIVHNESNPRFEHLHKIQKQVQKQRELRALRTA